jgi:vancomycin permeability regulator SanA
MVKEDRLSSAARGVALFLSLFSLINLITRLRNPAFDANEWWIDFRPLPAAIAMITTGALAALLLAWAVRPVAQRWRSNTTAALLLIATAVVLWNVVTFYRLLAAGTIHTPVPLPFSLIVAAALLFILQRSRRQFALLRHISCALAFLACGVAFPLAQIVHFGLTDYRRPAAAIVVLGARAYPNGRASDALEDRVLTAVELYKQGLAPRLIFSGGRTSPRVTEPQVMRRIAREHGIPESVVTLDDEGFTTDATVRNTAPLLADSGQPILAVSHGWHLPRIKLRYQAAGITAYTVPANERGQLLRKTPFLVAREIPALWLYYLRALVA